MKPKQSDSGWHLHGDTPGRAPPAACCLPRSTAPPLTTPNTPAISSNTLAPTQGGRWGGSSIPLALCPGAQGPEPSAWSPNAPYLPRVSPKPSPAGGQDWPRNLPPEGTGVGLSLALRVPPPEPGREARPPVSAMVGGHMALLADVLGMGPTILHPWQHGPFLQRGRGVSWSLGTP